MNDVRLMMWQGQIANNIADLDSDVSLHDGFDTRWMTLASGSDKFCVSS
jgi:hypothetical protein